MAVRLGVARHVIHLARKALREPILQMRETVRLGGGSDAGQLEAERVGLFFDAGFEWRSWKCMSHSKSRAMGSSKPGNTLGRVSMSPL